MAKRTIINRACKIALESHSEADNSFMNSEEDYDDGMQMPNQQEAMRDTANAQHADTTTQPKVATFAEPAEYEEVSEPQHAPQPTATVKSSRKCPI